MKKYLISVFTIIAGLGIVTPAQAAQMFRADINGNNIVPTPIPTSANGFGEFILNDAQTELFYDLTLNNLSLDSVGGTVTKIHFHLGDKFTASPFHVFNIYEPADDADAVFDTVSNPIKVTGIWSDADACTTPGCDLDDAPTKKLSDYLDELMSGNLYVNIHTSNFPGGEIRGQILSVSEPNSRLGLFTILGLLSLTTLHKGVKPKVDEEN